MRTARFGTALLGLMMASANPLCAQTAQKQAAKAEPAVAVPDLSKLNITSVLEQMQSAATGATATTLAAGDEVPPPIQTVVAFLQLRPDQQQVFGQLLQARQTLVAPLLVGIQQREQQLEALLASGGGPGDVGVLVIQIHALQVHVAQAQQGFLVKFNSLLDADQQQRLQAVRIGAQVQPLLPAFEQLYLL